VKFTATDPEVKGVKSGVAKIEYSVDGGAWTTGTSVKVTTDSANHIVKYRATDKVGNVEPEKTVPSFKIDKTKPTLSMNFTWTQIGINQYNIVITVIANDAMSGMQRVEWYWNGALANTVTGPGPNYVYNYTWTPGIPKYTIKAIAYDMAGLNDFKDMPGPESSEYGFPTQQSQLLLTMK
jgi:hypothetical protein